MPRRRKSASVNQHLVSPAYGARNRGHAQTGSASSISSFSSDQADLPTPAPTEGDTGTETELETERETDFEMDLTSRSQEITVPADQPSCNEPSDENTVPALASQHDLMNSYFRKDTLLVSNVDLLRCVTVQVRVPRTNRSLRL